MSEKKRISSHAPTSAIVRPMDIGEGLQWLLVLEPKGSHTQGGGNESSVFPR